MAKQNLKPKVNLPQLETAAISLLLFALVFAVYVPSVTNGFVNFDDDVYAFQNARVKSGLSWTGVWWAFSNLEAGFWHPLTWLSLMLDRQLFGLAAWGHHLTSMLLHAANAAVLFLALHRLTAARWRCAFVALLFGLHPLHVESVAWISERKDVLSAFFALLALWAYARYAEVSDAKCQVSRAQAPLEQGISEGRHPNLEGAESRGAGFTFHVSRFTHRASLYYLLCLAFFLCGLMSKTMVVTLPVLMLLLDWWPLQRFQFNFRHAERRNLVRLASEKIPFLLAALVLGLVTIHAERGVGALAGGTECPLADRLHNALVSYVAYLGQTFWPAGLAVYYPYPTRFPLWRGAGAGLLLLSVSALALWRARRQPYLFVGWFWYVLMLLPVIGIIRVGSFSRADRFTYLPLVGVFLLISWGAFDFAQRLRLGWRSLATAAAAVTIMCAGLTRHQLGLWNTSQALFSHALAVTGSNAEARDNLGRALVQAGEWAGAAEQFREAVKLAPGWAELRANLGAVLMKQGLVDDAVTELRAALDLEPGNPDAHCSLGDALAAKGRLEEAIVEYKHALKSSPTFATGHHNLAVALAMNDRLDEAISHFEEAILIRPDYAEACFNLGFTLMRKERLDEAVRQFERALRLDPKLAEAHRNLGVTFGRLGRLDEAISHFHASLKLKPESAEAHCNLGVALGRTGKLEEAIREFQEALRLQPDYADAQNNLRAAMNQKAAHPQ